MEQDLKVIELLRRLTPEQKLNTAARMYFSARELKLAALRSFHPDWSEEKIQQELIHAFATRG